MGALFGPHSVLAEAENARAVADAAGGGDLAMFDNEYNGGGTSDPAWAPFRQGYPDVPFTVTSLIQALEAGVQQVSPWTLTSTSAVASTQLGTDGCDNGLIELSQHCDGITRTLNPMFYLSLPVSWIRSAWVPAGRDDPGLPRVTAVQVTYDGYTYVLMANANAYSNATFDLGPGFPTEGNVRSTLFDPAAPIAPLIFDVPVGLQLERLDHELYPAGARRAPAPLRAPRSIPGSELNPRRAGPRPPRPWARGSRSRERSP